MRSDEQAAADVRRTIEQLIENGSTYNVDELDRLYHRHLKVFIVNDNGDVSVFDKASNMELFRERQAAGAEHLSRWAKFGHVEATGDTGFVILTRRMALRGRPEQFILAIHLALEEARWQVIQESVFVRPLE